MKQSRGFAWLPVLFIVIILGAVVGGGAYMYEKNQHKTDSTIDVSLTPAASSTPTTSTQTTTKTSTTPASQSITIDTSSLTTTSNTATITGTATGLTQVVIEVRDPELEGTVGDVLDSDVAPVVNGKWSFRIDAPPAGKYYNVAIYSHELDDSDYDKYYGNRVKLTRNSAYSVVSVPGMSKYTDSDFGFSFWYPTGWTVEGNGVGAQGGPGTHFGDGVVTSWFNVSNGTNRITVQEINSPSHSVSAEPGACGYCGPVTFYFDTALHAWMKVYPDGPNGAPDATPEQVAAAKIPKPADVSVNTMGGLHMFSDEQREEGTFVPLSAQHFLLVTGYVVPDPSHYDYQHLFNSLVKTIVATDPSVGTPVSAAEQTATIQAEQKAYAGQ